MNFIEKKAILVVSFGTSHENTRAVTIDAIESEIASAFPDFAIYRAWTSGMIIRKILKRDHVKIFTVSEAMEQMRADGITDVIIQPTHVINGIENDLMKEHALSFRDAFRSIRFGTPLLTSEADNRAVIAAVTETFLVSLPKRCSRTYGTWNYTLFQCNLCCFGLSIQRDGISKYLCRNSRSLSRYGYAAAPR